MKRFKDDPRDSLTEMDINQKIQAASHSGAHLKVIQKEQTYFVQKTMFTALEKNNAGIQKQIRFKSIKTPSYDVHAIPVTAIEKDEKQLSILMPYIEGMGGEHVALKGSKVVAKNLKTALDFYLIGSVSLSEDGVYPCHAIHEKLASIHHNLTEKYNLFPQLAQQIALLRSYCHQDLNMPMGTCHGDLTLSNLKVTEENQLYLFDFLSCEINSPLQDAAKLIQDFEHGWSFRKEKESVRIKGEIFCEYAYPSFLKTLRRLFHYEMNVLEALTILRIAPYIDEQDQLTIAWFHRVMDKITDTLSR